MDDEVTVITEECLRVWKVDGRKMFLPVMMRCYNVFDFQYMSISRITGEKSRNIKIVWPLERSTDTAAV